MTKSYRKTCPKCNSPNTKKDWKRKGRQSYKCNHCSHVWISSKRLSKRAVDVEKLYIEFALRKQTYKEIGDRFGMSIRTVQKHLDSYEVQREEEIPPRPIILLIDTTYFWEIGLMVFKDAEKKIILHFEMVNYETNDAYRRGVYQLLAQGREIKAIVCDWRRWLLWWFQSIPTQMCHFHQMQIIRRYITKNPILEPNQELKEIAKWLTRTEKRCLESELSDRYEKHEDFIKEKGINAKGKAYFVHRRTRAAYYSLRRNMKYLFVYLDYLWKLDIPNTTNWIEALFSHLKYKVNLHRWLRLDRKIKLITFLLLSR